MVRTESYGDKKGNKTETSLAHENLLEINPGFYKALGANQPSWEQAEGRQGRSGRVHSCE